MDITYNSTYGLSSSLSSNQHHRLLHGKRSAAKLAKLTADGCGQGQMCLEAPSFSSHDLLMRKISSEGWKPALCTSWFG
jgi:hypothetical protein